jgi:hypothetical protein
MSADTYLIGLLEPPQQAGEFEQRFWTFDFGHWTLDFVIERFYN